MLHLNDYKRQAEEILRDFNQAYFETVQEEYAGELQRELDKEKDKLKRKHRHGFFSGVLQSVTGSFVFIVCLAIIYLAIIGHRVGLQGVFDEARAFLFTPPSFSSVKQDSLGESSARKQFTSEPQSKSDQ